jgi:hypothetical protein
MTGSPRVRYSIPATSNGAAMNLGIYDMNGALVQTLYTGSAKAGDYSMPIARRGAAGAYFVRLSAGNVSAAAKAVITR